MSAFKQIKNDVKQFKADHPGQPGFVRIVGTDDQQEAYDADEIVYADDLGLIMARKVVYASGKAIGYTTDFWTIDRIKKISIASTRV